MATARALLVGMLLQGLGAAPPTQVGTWSGVLNALPNAQLIDTPLLGNGALGVLLDAHDAAHASPPSSVGPGRDGALDIWLGSASMWSCRACTTVAKGCCGAIAVGGVSIDASALGGVLAFAATQRIGNATLGATWTTARGGVLTTLVFMHPSLAVVVTRISWAPAVDDAAAPVLNVSTWAVAASTQHGAPTPASVGCANAAGTAAVACSSGGALLATVSRRATAGDSPRPVWAGLATGVASGTAGASAAAALSPGEGAWGPTLLVAVTSSAPVTLVTAEAEASSYDASSDPSLAAAALAAQFLDASGPTRVAAVASAWWSEYWSRSSVTISAHPLLEALYAGAAYVLGCTSSTDANVPPPALYGVWTTSDSANWNGDYTVRARPRPRVGGRTGHPPC